MNKRPSTLVNLTGGLGNQLFLLAAGLARGNEDQVILVTDYGSPRLNTHGEPELSLFNLPIHVKVARGKKRSWLMKKAIGYTLRNSLYPTARETLIGLPIISRLLTSILLSLSYKKLIRVTTSETLRKFMSKNRASEFLIGYFQEYMDASRGDVMKQLMSMSPRNVPSNFASIINESAKNRKMIVHVRLGDYRSETSFGILSKNYYHKAIESHFTKNSFEEIWIFSDEPEFCLDFVPEKYRHLSTIIDYFQQDSALTLELMRYGDAFVIANSTFSWWGAFLAYNRNAKVIFPSPWFKSRNFSEKLIPPNWTPVKQ